jgi:hypothetical protein
MQVFGASPRFCQMQSLYPGLLWCNFLPEQRYILGPTPLKRWNFTAILGTVTPQNYLRLNLGSRLLNLALPCSSSAQAVFVRGPDSGPPQHVALLAKYCTENVLPHYVDYIK